MAIALLIAFFSFVPRGSISNNGSAAQRGPARFEVLSIVSLMVSVLLLGETRDTALALSSPSPMGSLDALVSRIQTAQCALQVSVGRIPGTAMPKEWAASGAKLGFLLEVEFCDEPCADFEMTKERLLLGLPSAPGTASPSTRPPSGSFKAVEPLNDPTFVTAEGQQTIQVTEGAYGCDLQNFQSQQYGLRFFLDFPEGAKRNDVELPAERIYFISSCWIKDEVALERARNRHKELRMRLGELRENLSSLSSDQQGILGKVMGLRQMTLCVEQIKALEDQLAELEQTYPLQEPEMITSDSPQRRREFLEGPKGLLFAKDGVIAVKRYRGAMETREQYHWVGTFSFEEFFEDLDGDE